MGREVRRVPANWEHPRDERTGHHKPLYPGERYKPDEFLAIANAKGLQEALDEYGRAPNADDYMPNWPQSERTHYMMYEDTSEGTPISPAFETPEELARWLVDNNASAMGTQGRASYEGWLRVARGGFAPSMIYSPQTGMVNGVDGLLDSQANK